ncbi:F-box associated interaction domain-containing protein [Artemisia annua]|uniref:F-box associated interaction domain-containing protein n=1 Tax=Artemisia annua TaxID=35608 RepID=A0A2U1NSC5_ARTAN|nr:F-box associated interaction domain-containing protein [Artemisia annua]
MISSCNGLLCYVQDRDTPFIYNPSTKICNTLPSSGFSCAGYTFGYDESTHDYKVIALYRDNKAKIYSFKTGVWKNINNVPRIPARCKRGTFSNGAFHWMVRKKVVSSFQLTSIVSLDLATETFGEVSPPVYDDECNRCITLGALGDWLCVIVHYNNNEIRADLWVMKVYGVNDSWTKLVSIPYFTHLGFYLVPLSISNDGKVLLKTYHKLLVYDSINCTFTEIHDFGAKFEACSLVESLVSPHAPLI